MAQRRFHYEQAFEHYLRANRVPYVAVDEAKKALLPATGPREIAAKIKSFDFVVYLESGNLLVDVKGRMFGRPPSRGGAAGTSRRFESWVTQEDVDSLQQWQDLFGVDFTAVFVFAYCLRQQPADALFEEVFAFNERWYALRSTRLADYRREMVPRSARWGTVHVPGEVFARISRPFTIRGGERAPDGRGERGGQTFGRRR